MDLDILQTAWAGAWWARAGELITYTTSGVWSDKDITQFESITQYTGPHNFQRAPPRFVMPGAPFKVKAIYDYKSTEPDDLNFPNGQIITVTAEEDDDWYAGEYVDGTGKKLE